MPRPNTKKIEAAEFDRAVPLMRALGDKTIAMARAYMVDGKIMPDIAAEHGVTRSGVQAAIRAVERHVANAREVLIHANTEAGKRVKGGAIQETFVAPPHVIRQLRALYRTLTAV
jgi:hypothetical protein